jgi:hypothetical protein
MDTVGDAALRRALPDRGAQILTILPEDRRGQRQVPCARSDLGDDVDEQHRPLARHQAAEEADYPGVRRAAQLRRQRVAGAGAIDRRGVGIERAVHNRALARRRQRTGPGRREVGYRDHTIGGPRRHVAQSLGVRILAMMP